MKKSNCKETEQDTKPWEKDWMNGTNLHETGVRQMGRAERGGRGRGETKEEEWLLIKERGGETDTGSMWVKGRLWRGGGWERPHKHLLKNSKGTPGKRVAYVMYIFKTCFGILRRIMWTADTETSSPHPQKEQLHYLKNQRNKKTWFYAMTKCFGFWIKSFFRWPSVARHVLRNH